jgi:hypothetical protein
MPIAPAGIWEYECEISFNGNTGSDSQLVDFVSAFTANLITRIFAPNEAEPGDLVHIFIQGEVDDIAVAPDMIPRCRIGYVDETVSPFEHVEVVSNETARNVIDYSLTIQGTLYQLNWTAGDSNKYTITCRATTQGTPIRSNHQIDVKFTESSDLTPLINEVSQSIDLFGLHMATLVILIGLIVWAEFSKEWAVYLLSTLASGAVGIAIPEGLETFRWILFAAALYTIIRMVLEIREIRIAGKKESEDE